MECRILVLQPGIEPIPTPAVEARRLNHWIAGEVPESAHLWLSIFQLANFKVISPPGLSQAQLL